mmetsp:Transcript_15415/g.18766  ORF Transcript_15415/g.18766 Transcript_15415/m.18766 type:complete len:482 (+) Transcript_15415:93-1538(+)
MTKCVLHPGEASCRPTKYWGLLRENSNYRYYLLAHCMEHLGDWFIGIAAILSVERLAPDSATAISIITLCKFIPEVFVTPIGGVLSDIYDRRRLMIYLDSVSAFIALSYVIALRSGNVHNLFLVTVLRSTVSSIYEPITKSIVPMFVTNAEDLTCAATLNSMAWSTMLLLGGILGGYAASTLGVEACYVIDFLTYIVSALVMLKVKGDFRVFQTHESNNDNLESDKDGGKKKLMAKMRVKLSRLLQPIKSFITMTIDLFMYLFTCGFGLCVLLKASGTLCWGSQDVLNASFSYVHNDEGETSRRLGIIYSCAGIGCLLGPIISNLTIVHGDRPNTIQLACIGAFMFIITGWLGIASAPSFEVICLFTIVRAMGESIIWMNASLLLQTLTSPAILGRMLGFEYSMARLTEAITSFVAGRLEDSGYGKHEIATLQALSTGVIFIFWTIYHLFGSGAANKRFSDFFHSGTSDVASFPASKSEVV